MVKGQPDYQGVLTKSETSIKPSQMFPTGRVIFYDDFEFPTPKYNPSIFGGGSVNIVNTLPFEGSGCVILTCGAVNNNFAYMNYGVGLPRSQKLVLEFAFSLNSTQYVRLLIWFKRYDGVNLHTAYVYYVQEDNAWYYGNSAGGVTILTNGSMKLLAAAGSYHRFKLVADFELDTFISLQLDEHFIDMSALSLRSTASVIYPYIKVEFGLIDADSVSTNVSIDNVVVTEED